MILGLFIPIFFIFLDINEFGLSYTWDSIRRIQGSQRLHSIGLIIFPILFGLIDFLHNLTKKKSEELSTEREFIKNVVESMSDLLLVINHKNEIITVNNNTIKILGHEESEILGLSIEKILDDNEISKKIKNLEIIKEANTGFVAKNGKVIPMLVSTNAIKINTALTSNKMGLVLTAKDERESRILSELKKSSMRIIESEKLASIGILAAGVGHEINNPLAIIKGSLNDFLKKYNKGNINGEIVNKFYTNQLNAIERISNITTGLRNYTRVESSEFEAIDVNKALLETLDMINIIFEKEGIKILRNFNVQNVKIWGKRGVLQQVLLNLLSNAQHAMDNNIDKCIEITTELSHTNILIKVTDNGTGIKKENIKKIFDSFYTTKELGKGTGLGLSLSYKFIKEMNGNIEVDSELGRGTTFTILLPQKVVEDKVDNITSVNENKAMELSGKVLVIEDEEYLRDLLVEDLKDLGLDVDEAENGILGLEKFNNNDYDLIFTDLKMPEMDGDNFIKKAKLRSGKNTKFIIITGGFTGKNPEEEEQKIDQIADEKLFKPYDIEDLYRISAKFLK